MVVALLVHPVADFLLFSREAVAALAELVDKVSVLGRSLAERGGGHGRLGHERFDLVEEGRRLHVGYIVGYFRLCQRSIRLKNALRRRHG